MRRGRIPVIAGGLGMAVAVAAYVISGPVAGVVTAVAVVAAVVVGCIARWTQ